MSWSLPLTYRLDGNDASCKSPCTMVAVIVVDVENRESEWHDLTPYEGGLSGWRLLWDRVCPIPYLR